MVLQGGSIRTATRVLPSEPEKKSCSVEVKEAHINETRSTTHYDNTARAARPRLRAMEQMPAADASPLTCPVAIQVAIQGDTDCQAPRSLRVAYGVESLMQRGYTGKGQTIVDIVSYSDPSLQHNMDIFDQSFGLPPITLQVMSPIGSVPFNQHNIEMSGWADETTLDCADDPCHCPWRHSRRAHQPCQ